MDSVTAFLHLPITDPTWVFLIVLAIILLAPMILSRLRIPHVVGMILAGVLVGQHGLNLLERDTSFSLFGQVGLYYIMFLAGLEMDLQSLKQQRLKGLIFGVFTSFLPFFSGLAAAVYLLHQHVASAVLLACILTSHTLVSYPIVGRYRVSRHKSVTISVAATMFALLVALFILAIQAGMLKGTSNLWFWLAFVGKVLVFVWVIFWVYPRVIPRFFRAFSDPVMQFIFVLTMVFLSAAIASLCGLEGILGVFLAGLVFNRFIPRTAPLMNRVEFMGNAIFIPYFLIGVGMLVNLRPLFTSTAAQIVAAVFVVVGTLSKYIAAFISRRLFRLSPASGLMMFGLSEAHAAGALAMVMVGTRLEIAPGVPLMSSTMLDGVVVMIFVSCIIASITTDQAARRIKLEMEHDSSFEARPKQDDEKILIPLNDLDNLPQLLQTAIFMRNAELNRGLICLNIVNETDPGGLLHLHSHECLQEAQRICAAADVKVQTQSRLAVNFTSGVVHAFHENDASEIIIGAHHRRGPQDSVMGRFAVGLISSLNRQILIVHYTMPLNVLRRMVVSVPERAQYEAGFYRWVERIARLAIEIGCRVEFHATAATGELIRNYLEFFHPLIRDEYKTCDELLPISQYAEELHPDHLLVVVSARPGTISFDNRMRGFRQELATHFSDRNLIVVFPDQEGDAPVVPTFSAPLLMENHGPSRLSAWLSHWVSRIG